MAHSVFFDNATGKLHIVHCDDSAGSKDANDVVRTEDGPITTLMRQISVCAPHWVLQFASTVLCLDKQSVVRLAKSIEMKYRTTWTDAQFDVHTWVVSSPYRAFDAKEFLRDVDEQARRQNSQSSTSILAEYSDLISGKDQADALERHRERDKLLSRLGCKCKPWGSGEVQYGIDGISLHDDATKGASRAGGRSNSSAILRESYAKKSEQNMTLINKNYRLTNEVDNLRAQLEELRKTQT